jgi:uncharacterized membrane-anchored protein
MTSRSSIRRWRFWIPIALQIALICAVPAQAIYVHLTGKTVFLKTAPVDPYSLLLGYSQTLAYDISQIQTLQSLKGWETLTFVPGSKQEVLANQSTVYVILQAPSQSNPNQPQAWKPIAVSGTPPKSLPANQIALKGQAEMSRIVYNLETYYMPENQRREVNETVVQANRKQTGVVEIKVDAQGNAVPISLWVGDRIYRF